MKEKEMQEKEPRYNVQPFGRWLYVIVDNKKQLLARKPGKEHITDRAYDEKEAMFMTFKRLEDAMAKCNELNAHVKIKLLIEQ